MKKRLIHALFAVVLIAGCSDSNTNRAPAAQPVPLDDIVTIGTITGFGSVISNGIEFNTDSATVTMDDEPGNLSDLRIGMIVTIRGIINVETGTATADTINFSGDTQGPATTLDMANSSFVVLGQTVIVDEFTVFDEVTFDTLFAGNIVQVSGHWRNQNRIQATHIERKADAYAAGMRMEVKGEISGLNLATQHFNIGTQACDYSAAMLELGNANLANGLYVEVSSTSALSDGDMILDQVRARDQDRDREQLCDSGCSFELDGYVTQFVSPVEFEVDGSPATTNDSTVYVNGTVDTLAIDVKLAVSGTLNADGVLVADRIVFRLPSLVEIEADVEAIDATNAVVTVLGIAVTTNESTLFRDHSAADVRAFSLDDLATGDRIEIRAYEENGTLMATRLERDDADDGVTLKALVEAIAQPSVTLLGIAVTADQDTVFQNEARETIDADEFFSLIVVGSLVKAEGVYDGSSILASKLFLRVCYDSCF